MHEKRIPFRRWVGLAALVVLVWVLSFAYAEKSTGVEIDELLVTRGDIGFITKNTHLCHTDSITEKTISGLTLWAALIKRLEAVNGDHLLLSESDNALGNNLSRWCATLSEGYPVLMWTVKDDHAIVFWVPSLGFGNQPFIIRLEDFQAGGLRL